MKNLILNNKSILIAAAMLASLSGCALVPQHVDLAYQPQGGVSQIPEASKVTVAVQVKDARQDTSKVGALTGSLGAERAAIIPTEDVAVTVRHAIEHELQDRGFKSGSDATVNIVADVTKFYNKFDVGLWTGIAKADLDINITVKSRNGVTLYSNQLAANGLVPNRVLYDGANAKLALDQALANAMKTLFNDKAFIAALLTSTTAN